MPMFTYYDTDSDAPVYYVTHEPQPSHTESMFQSESETTVSGVTIGSDQRPDYFVLQFGRPQPANANVTRWYPSDSFKRQILMHIVGKWRFGGLYCGPMDQALAPASGHQRYALELGTGLGTWAQEIATEFPHVEFRSLDIVPAIAHAPRSNVLFEVYDFTKGLLLQDNSQDVVFMNLMTETVIDYRSLLREVHRVLRPGGYIHIREYSLEMWDPEDISTPARHTNPLTCRFFELLRAQLARAGADPEVPQKLPDWLSPESDIWDQNSKTDGFEQIESVLRTWPAYPHEEHSCMDGMDPQLASLVRYSSSSAVRESFSMMRYGGLEAEETNKLIEGVLEEMKDPQRCGLIKGYRVYAVKRLTIQTSTEHGGGMAMKQV